MSSIESPFEYLDLSWEMFGELCRALALQVARDYDPDVVVGLARTGTRPCRVVGDLSGRGLHSLSI